MSSPSNDDDFVTITTKHRKKQQQPAALGDTANKKPPTASNGASSSSNSNISLRPRTMFAMKGRGRTESEGSAYRPQWSKDGEGFVSASSGGPTSFKDAATGGGQSDDHRGERRKSKVLRYTKEELLALHFTTTEAPKFPPETTVASEHSLPPVSTLPFDYEEIYKQWSLNRNRGRGRGRGNAPSGGQQGTRGQQERGSRGDDTEGAKQRDEQRHNERDSTWERGAKITEGSHGDDVWDDVLEPGADSNEMDLSSMAEAAEKFRREMDAMREELQGPKIDPDEIKDDLDAFDKKLEDAAAAGQFDDSDNEEVQWDDPAPDEQLNSSTANDPLEDRESNLLGRFGGLSSLRLEVEDEWFYLDPQGLQQGPFKTAEMREWFEAGYFKPHLPIRFGREGIFTPLANQFVHGQMPFAAPPSDGMQIQFQSDYRTQHQLNIQNTQPQGSMFLNDEVQRRDQAFWPNAAPEMSGLENPASAVGELQSARPLSPVAPESTEPPAPKSPAAAPVVDAWGARPKSPDRPSPTLFDIQNEEKRRVANEVRKKDDQTDMQQEQLKAASPIKSPQKERKAEKETVASQSKKNGKSVKTETNAWATKASTDNSKSLKDIQQEEQREMLNKMSADKGDNANLAQMGAQLKMMLGVDSTAVAPNAPSPPAPSPPAQVPTTKAAPAPAPAAPAASPWGTPAVVTKSSASKSMRDILAEEERLAQERAKASENTPTNSHWMNIVAGNKVAAAAIPKPSRSVLGPVPASVLKSRQQIRAANGAAKPSPPKTESDASFWNFGAAQKESTSTSAQVGTSNAFGSKNVSSEFMTWALKQLKTIDSNADVTLLEYCATVEDPGEVREYLAAYLGSTPRVSAFATEFIQRKKTQHSGKKSPGHLDAQQRASETGSSNKRGKRRSKGQKIDPSLLNYSVGS
ncbi:PERQ amino acid-rich with GYF domain-containing protein [Phytophthora nicotianae]|uniref:PERQ amino acid-rich with GYF domain-containing protein n=1 Tax=Phytophthora nicotianae TaxID=4792 RepID=A0A0W8BZB7_PHYNI|nr:PERQ amino acid-rich with GYF domain-containing protein [Phytophthora nicotianae]